MDPSAPSASAAAAESESRKTETPADIDLQDAAEAAAYISEASVNYPGFVKDAMRQQAEKAAEISIP